MSLYTTLHFSCSHSTGHSVDNNIYCGMCWPSFCHLVLCPCLLHREVHILKDKPKLHVYVFIPSGRRFSWCLDFWLKVKRRIIDAEMSVFLSQDSKFTAWLTVILCAWTETIFARITYTDVTNWLSSSTLLFWLPGILVLDVIIFNK